MQKLKSLKTTLNRYSEFQERNLNISKQFFNGKANFLPLHSEIKYGF